MRGVDERRIGAGGRLLQDREQARGVWRQTGSNSHEVGEGDERRRVAGVERVDEARTGGAQLHQAFTLHAPAHVERQHDVDRCLFEADQFDALPHAVVEHLEVRWTQATNHLTIPVHRHVDADSLDARREH